MEETDANAKRSNPSVWETSVFLPAAVQEGGRVTQQVRVTPPTLQLSPACLSLFALPFQVSFCLCILSLWKSLCINSEPLFLFLHLWKTQSKGKINASHSNKKRFHGIYVYFRIVQTVSVVPHCNLWDKTCFMFFFIHHWWFQSQKSVNSSFFSSSEQRCVHAHILTGLCVGGAVRKAHKIFISQAD